MKFNRLQIWTINQLIIKFRCPIIFICDELARYELTCDKLMLRWTGATMNWCCDKLTPINWRTMKWRNEVTWICISITICWQIFVPNFLTKNHANYTQNCEISPNFCKQLNIRKSVTLNRDHLWLWIMDSTSKLVKWSPVAIPWPWDSMITTWQSSALHQWDCAVLPMTHESFRSMLVILPVFAGFPL